jgi:hypothetical protein
MTFIFVAKWLISQRMYIQDLKGSVKKRKNICMQKGKVS